MWLFWVCLAVVIVGLASWVWWLGRALATARESYKRACTERESLAGEARAQGEFLRNIIDTVPGFVCVKGLGGRFDLANRTLAEAYGTTTSDIVGKSDYDFNVDEEEVSAFLADDREVITQRRAKHIPAEKFTTGNGEEHWIETTKVPLVEKDGSCSRLLAVALDITERRHLEQELFQSQKMNAIGQLAGGVAHDFNNILTAIYGAADILGRRVVQDKDAAQLCRLIVDAAAQATKLTHQLLAFSRKGPLTIVSVDIHEVIERVMQLLEHTIDKRITLVRNLASTPLRLLGDPTYVQNAILNLAVNGRDAMPQGGTLTFSTAEVFLDEEDCKDVAWDVTPGRYMEVSVADTGVGMDEATRDRIFEPFFTTKAQGRGTGLGLAAVYGTVRSHKGKMAVFSEPGRGSVFKLYLRGTDAPAVQVKADEDARRGSGRVLLVDDERIVRAVVREMLLELGYDVAEAEDGQAAIEMVERDGPFVAVILDLMMPRMNGVTAFEALRKTNASLPIIVASGFSAEGDVERVIAGGAAGFLHKPYRRTALARILAGTQFPAVSAR